MRERATLVNGIVAVSGCEYSATFCQLPVARLRLGAVCGVPVRLFFWGGVLGYEVAFRGGLRGSSEVPRLGGLGYEVCA